MSEQPTLREQLAKLSPADRDKYNFDMVAYGNAVLRELEDGTVVYVPPAEWPPMDEKALRSLEMKALKDAAALGDERAFKAIAVGMVDREIASVEELIEELDRRHPGEAV